MYVRLGSALLCALYVTLQLTYAYSENEIDNALRLVERMGSTREGLMALRKVIDGIDNDLKSAHKRSAWGPGCAISAGMPGYQCHLQAIRNDEEKADWVAKNRFSPGKKRGAERSITDIASKRKGLSILKRLLSEMDSDLVVEQKRTCQVNLGGHCATESAANIADQWHYLNSPVSPGRKRRDTQMFRKLITGKLL